MTFIYSIKCSSPYFFYQSVKFTCACIVCHMFFSNGWNFFEKKTSHACLKFVTCLSQIIEIILKKKKMVVSNRNHNFYYSLNFPIMVKFSIKIETYNVLLIYLGGGGYKARFSIDHHSACIFKNIISCGVKPLLNKGGF